MIPVGPSGVLRTPASTTETSCSPRSVTAGLKRHRDDVCIKSSKSARRWPDHPRPAMVWSSRGRGMLKGVTLILSLLITPAAADDYRSYREAYAGLNWPTSMTSTEQCQRRVADVVARFGFRDV